jgi:hypothetical protein
MRRAAALVLFALLAVAMAFAQTPAGTSNNPSTTPQTQTAPAPSGTTTTPAPSTGEDTQKNSTQSNSSQTQTTGTGAAQPAGQNQPVNPNATTPNQPSEQTTPTANSAAVIDQVTAGTEIRAVLDTPLSTRTSKPGDRFTATIADQVRGNNGSVVIPGGTRVEGEVAEADEGKALAALRGKGKLSLRFRDVVLPNGQTLPLTATLVSVNDTNGKNTKKADEEGQVQSGTRNKDVAKDVGIGAGVGTVAGLIFGGPLKGLAIGALAGGGYVLATKGKDVNLPAQTGMVIRLDQPVTASGPSAPLQR